MLISTCEAVLWGEKDGYKFTNWLCGEAASIKLGTYCEKHVEATGEAPSFIRRRK